jgi:hypothetical protein
MAAFALVLALGLPARSQGTDPLGPIPTRDQFPLNLLTLAYQPVPPDTLAPGAWEADLQCVEANTLEFSDVIKNGLLADPHRRLNITRDWAQTVARDNANLPVVFLFQMETTMTTLRLRAGLDAGREAWIEVPCFSYSGGFEDSVIEAVHRIGFYQAGRTSFPENQVRVMVIQQGKVVYYNDQAASPKLQDPVLGFTQTLYSAPHLVLAASLQVKPALTHTLDGMRSGWDSGLQLTGRWSPNGSLDTYFGGGVVKRESGTMAFNQLGFRDQLGFHLMVEGRRNATWRPFFQLVYLTGAAHSMAGEKLGLTSLQHDLGVHWVYRPNLVFTFRYMNNITNNENTADMALIGEVTWCFRGK